MAKMFPQQLPKDVLDDKRRSSEVQVYNALSEQLDDNYHVFYSSPWLGTNTDGSEIDGEADFFLVGMNCSRHGGGSATVYDASVAYVTALWW